MEDCGECPSKSGCTRSDRRTPAFLPQQLYERQAAVRATRQTRPWQANYAMRAGAWRPAAYRAMEAVLECSP